jgi:hypothetical protein
MFRFFDDMIIKEQLMVPADPDRFIRIEGE